MAMTLSILSLFILNNLLMYFNHFFPFRLSDGYCMNCNKNRMKDIFLRCSRVGPHSRVCRPPSNTFFFFFFFFWLDNLQGLQRIKISWERWKRAICIKALKPSLNKDGGRYNQYSITGRVKVDRPQNHSYRAWEHTVVSSTFRLFFFFFFLTGQLTGFATN